MRVLCVCTDLKSSNSVLETQLERRCIYFQLQWACEVAGASLRSFRALRVQELWCRCNRMCLSCAL